MMGKRSGVSTQISAEQPKAMTTHCQEHSLSLAIKSLTKDCTILRNTLGTVGEICVLVNNHDEESLIAELQLLPTIFEEECPPINLEDVVKVIKSFAPEKRKLIQNVVTVIKIILTNGATSATPERFFSMLRRIKTWLRS